MPCSSTIPPCVNFETLDGSTIAVKQNVIDIAGSGYYDVTPELCRSLKHIDNGVNHIRLDHDILKTERWNRLCDPATTFVHRQGAINAMHHATEHLLDVKDRIAADTIHGTVDNTAREAHHLALQDLKGIESAVRPYVHDSTARLKQYCDNVGVTDRYVGYRNNLNRGNRHPKDLAFSWYDPANKQPNTTIMVRPESEAKYKYLVRNPCYRPTTVYETCGINMAFPGTTEYTDRYTGVRRDRPSVDYPINPTADYRIDGRPMARQKYLCTDTEYQVRFEWPDGNKICMFPWLRK